MKSINQTAVATFCTLFFSAICIADADMSLFMEGSLAEEVTTESCTLSDGTESTCYRVTIVGRPVNDTGNTEVYCPSNVEAGAAEGGLWFDGDGTVYNVTGEFLSNLADIYDDDRWQMYDEATGEITVITGPEGCEVAGDPRGPGYDNFCLECKLSELNGGVQRTMLIPVNPKPLQTPTRIRRQNIGVAFNSVLFGPPAPVDMILGSYSLGVFDDCGAHANPHEGYHYHGATGCSEIVPQEDGHSAQMGIAIDGFGIFAELGDENVLNEVLDECGGSTDDVRGYHYHAFPAGLNKIIGCISGAQANVE